MCVYVFVLLCGYEDDLQRGGRRQRQMCFFLMIRRPPRSTRSRSSAASDVYKRQLRSCAARRACASSFAVCSRRLSRRAKRNWTHPMTAAAAGMSAASKISKACVILFRPTSKVCHAGKETQHERRALSRHWQWWLVGPAFHHTESPTNSGSTR